MQNLLLTGIFLSFFIFFIPKNMKYWYTLLLLLTHILISSIWAAESIFYLSSPVSITIIPDILNYDFSLHIDKLSGFFLIVINFTSLMGFIYAYKYLEPYKRIKFELSFSIHYFSYLWLYLSMILVVCIQDGPAFIIMWEIMALSSFMLVIFNAENRTIMKTGINYLIQMHIGMIFILIAFLIAEKDSNILGFRSLDIYFSEHMNFPLFVIFFLGFGLKAGFIPLHTWLPQAHPAAPSHVSAVMSGVMIKMGIYGIMRVTASLHNDLFSIGIFVLSVSLISGVLGVMMAITQHDLKKLLAYHSIENIGIIGIGVGIGIIGTSQNMTLLSVLGYSGALLHVLNHSLFKSLLFFCAGSVLHSTKTKDVEQLGGLIKKMPYTAALFLFGSLSICGLPPFNGFISEYLIYSGMFKSLANTDLYMSFILVASITGLTLIGGLALFCFTKAFGVTFLGQPRSGKTKTAKEVSTVMLVPGFMILIVILLIGLASSIFTGPILLIVTETFNLSGLQNNFDDVRNSITKINVTGLIFIITVALIYYVRRVVLKTKIVTYGPTWGCGYTAGNSRHQYTSTSFADNFTLLAKPILRTTKNMESIGGENLFPESAVFRSKNHDIFKDFIIEYPKEFILKVLKKIAVMQTGQINHYILYAFLFILGALLLTYFKLI